MQLPLSLLGAFAAMMGISWAEQSHYIKQLSTLSTGAMDTSGNSSGIVWLNITNFAPEKLPYIQQDLGIFTYDNLNGLKTTASLAATAASNSHYGDLVYFFTAFAMNVYSSYIDLSSEEMQQGLLTAVTPQDSTVPDQTLIDLYADTSSIASLREAFLALKTHSLEDGTTLPEFPNPDKQKWTKAACSKAHKAVTSACKTLIQNVSVNATWKSGGPRSICKGGCCVSWSANATFQIQNLTNAANYCVSTCANSKVSCEVWGVSLQGTVVDQCLSNRASGCK